MFVKTNTRCFVLFFFLFFKTGVPGVGKGERDIIYNFHAITWMDIRINYLFFKILKNIYYSKYSKKINELYIHYIFGITI